MSRHAAPELEREHVPAPTWPDPELAPVLPLEPGGLDEAPEPALRRLGFTAGVDYRLRPQPMVTIGGQIAPNSGTALGDTGRVIPGGVDPADPAGQVVLDGVSCTWGVDEPLEQAEPATASFSVLDFTRSWAVGDQLMGEPVRLWWRIDDTARGITDSRTYFRGRITSVALTRHVVQLPDGRTRMATRVDVRCTSIETDLANRQAGGAMPEESLGARADRIAGMVGGVASAVTVRDYWRTPTVYAEPASTSRTVRDVLVQLYNSTGGDRLVYSPERLTYEWLNRRQQEVRSMGLLTSSAAASAAVRAGQGVHIIPARTGNATGVDTAEARRGYLDGRLLEHDDTVGKTSSSRITRSQVTHKDTGVDGDPARTVIRVDPDVNETATGQRAITLDAIHGWNDWANLNAEDLLAMATQEGSQWRPNNVRWDTRRSGGFDTYAQVHTLLRGHATAFQLFLSSSYLPTFGIRPIFSVIGGTITYTRGAWVVDMTLAGWATSGGGNASPFPVPQHSISWSEVDDGQAANTIVWGRADDVPSPLTFHSSVTYEDLAFVGYGLFTDSASPAATAPASRWDTFQ